jgi:electron-transferring-flavoprotein dehydrogenase
MNSAVSATKNEVPRERMDVDIACVGFGPAMGGFLTTLSRLLVNEDGTPAFESSCAPGMPLQVICYERAEGLGFGVSGAVTRGRGIRHSFPGVDVTQIPMAAPVKHETLVYLLDPVKASRRPFALRAADRMIRLAGPFVRLRDEAVELPFIPRFMNKEDGFVMSLGQFNQWVGEQLTASGLVQIWPGSPVSEPLIEDHAVRGVRLADQGTNLRGQPEAGFMPGMDIHAPLTVVADGPVGPVGRRIDEKFGMPPGNQHTDWALGMKMVCELPKGTALEAGTVIHTLGFPEPEIFGFFYVHPEGLASVGIFIPSWMRTPVRTAYRYLQHFAMHPYLWRYLNGGNLKSWGAKSLQESGRRGEPFLAGNGYARIGEGSGSTNVLTGSGVDEAWTTGVQLAEAVAELLQKKMPFTQENLQKTYVRRRRTSWVDQEAQTAADSRNGFERGWVSGMLGLAFAAYSHGKVAFPRKPEGREAEFSLEEAYQKKIPAAELVTLKEKAAARGLALHDLVMNRCGWPEIPYDGKLLVSHQDALLTGGGVQAPAGYANHVVFLRPEVCRNCEPKLCAEMCSGQAITRGEAGLPAFDREKCIFCGACLWNCTTTIEGGRRNVEFRAGAGGLHSAMN